MITDKVAHGYGDFYRSLASSFAGSRCNLVEIGAAQGDGLRWLQGLFPAATLVGVELDPERAAAAESAGWPVYLGNATHPGLPTWLYHHFSDGQELIEPRPLDVVIDDGSHHPAEIKATFDMLWPMLAPGGAYVVEDWSHVDRVMVRELERWAAQVCGRTDAAGPAVIDRRGIMCFRRGL